MNCKISDSLFCYLEVLYKVNQNTLKLCGADIYCNTIYHIQKLVYEIIRDIPTLIPYICKGNELELQNSDGLLEYQKDISYLKETYSKILNSNRNTIDNIRKIRNKYEHKMHVLDNPLSFSGSTSLYSIVIKLNKNKIKVETEELIKLIKDLNILFSKIVEDIRKYAEDNKKTDYPYYKKIIRFNFIDFNDIYNCKLDLLKKIGKTMYNF